MPLGSVSRQSSHSGKVVHRQVKLHRSAEHALEERVVQILCDPRPFRQPLLRPQMELVPERAHVGAVQRPGEGQ